MKREANKNNPKGSMETYHYNENALGTSIDITIRSDRSGQEIDTVVADVFSRIRLFEAHYSRFREDSMVSRMNRNIGKPQVVEDELFSILERAESLREQSDGHFNIAIESILSAWGYDAGYSFLESGI